ncbi:cohesin subunit SA-2 [Drosophila eugracilis]|uniref:cohesin subunit SA-2 n=1 Tax=Drosophila eugracilis TaxID=29029 RepID=UPI0007E7EDDA|nr:cohesin subunit SA-2 [Drosophila eugracilis]
MDIDTLQAADQTTFEEVESSRQETFEKPTATKTLLQSVQAKDKTHEYLATRWVKFFLGSPSPAFLTLMEFLFEASGCLYEIPKDTEMPFPYADILVDCLSKCRSVSLQYPVITKRADIFIRKIVSFFQALLNSANIMPDALFNKFLEELLGFVMAFSQSSARPIRHTSTLLGLKLMTILKDQTSMDQELPKTVWEKMFNCLFVDRRMDVVDNIRAVCLTELGLWFQKYPEGYLQDSNLWFIFEALGDSSAEVRQLCLSIITRLLPNEHLRPTCLELGQEFRELLLSFCMDKEDELAEESLRLLADFYQYSPEILSPDTCLLLEQLMFAAHRGLAQAAGEFFMMRRKVMEGETFPERINPLLLLYAKDSPHEHAAYLVDSLLDKYEIILDWQSMIWMLVDDESGLNEDQCSSLIEILTVGVKQAITGEIPAGRITKDLERNPKEGAKKKATALLAPILPELLQSYASRLADLKNLLELPQHLELQYYKQKTNDRQLRQLLYEINTVMFHQTDYEVLQIAAHTLDILYAIGTTRILVKELIDSAVTNYRLAWQEIFDVENSSSSSSSESSFSTQTPESDYNRMLISLRLVTALYARFNLSGWQMNESVLGNLRILAREQLVLSSYNMLTETVALYLECGFYSLCWDLGQFQDEASKNPNMKDSLCALKKNLDDFMFASLNPVLEGGHAILIDLSFSYVCDLLVMFGYHLRESSYPSVRSLAYSPSACQLDLLEKCVVDNIFEMSPSDLMAPDNFGQLQNMRGILNSYCKLVSFNVVPTMKASKIFQYYGKYFEPFGDIMKCTMEHALHINPINYAMTLFHSCLHLFSRIMSDNDQDGLRAANSAEFSELIELANRLAETIKSNLLENRQCIIVLNRAGVMFVKDSLQGKPTAVPQNLLFLRVCQVFVPLLLRQDKLTILKLVKTIEEPALPSCKREDWQNLQEFCFLLSPSKRGLK